MTNYVITDNIIVSTCTEYDSYSLTTTINKKTKIYNIRRFFVALREDSDPNPAPRRKPTTPSTLGITAPDI
jgi:hypothetical protein